MSVAERVSGWLWTPWLLGLFLLTGLYYSVRTGFFQLFGLRHWLGETLLGGRSRGGGAGSLTPLQSLWSALASTLGTGSIAGVATAIVSGGPGAVFWMWICALLGMMTGCAEKILTMLWRRRQGSRTVGGPMYYLAYGLKSPLLAGWWSVACMGGALVGGGLVQSGSVAVALEQAVGFPPLGVSVGTAVLAGVVLAGGLGRIARVSQVLVPVMGLGLVGGSILVLWLRREVVPQALNSIFACALTPRSALGGACGYTVTAALRYGLARGVFTNEAGMGSTALAHAEVREQDPARQGLWAMVEVLIATGVICTLVALVILCGGVYDPLHPGSVTGVELTAGSFRAVLGPAGQWLVTVSVVLFGFTSVVGWCFYGECAAKWLFGKAGALWWVWLFLAVTALGGLGETRWVWQMVDLFTALMALPNLLALLFLSPAVLECLRDHCKNASDQ